MLRGSAVDTYVICDQNIRRNYFSNLAVREKKVLTLSCYIKESYTELLRIGH